MQSNAPLLFLAICVMLLGASVAFTNKSRPNGIAHNFGLVTMVSGIMMTGGICLFFTLSAVIYIFRGH